MVTKADFDALRDQQSAQLDRIEEIVSSGGAGGGSMTATEEDQVFQDQAALLQRMGSIVAPQPVPTPTPSVQHGRAGVTPQPPHAPQRVTPRR